MNANRLTDEQITYALMREQRSKLGAISISKVIMPAAATRAQRRSYRKVSSTRSSKNQPFRRAHLCG